MTPAQDRTNLISDCHLTFCPPQNEEKSKTQLSFRFIPGFSAQHLRHFGQIASLLLCVCVGEGGGCYPVCIVEHLAASLAPTQQMPVKLPNQVWQPKMCGKQKCAPQWALSLVGFWVWQIPCHAGEETEKEQTLIKNLFFPKPQTPSPIHPCPYAFRNMFFPKTLDQCF